MTLPRESIGASQAPVAVGLHPFTAPLELWAELVGEKPPFEGNEATRWGLLLEPAVRQAYADERGVEVTIPAAPFFRDGWKRASPDGLVMTDGVRVAWGVEIKTSSQFLSNEWGGEGTDEVPLHYVAQCAWSMHVLDVDRWDLAALIGGRDFRIFKLERDREFEEDLVQGVTTFWERHVLARLPPPVDGSAAWAEYIATKLPWRRDDYVKADEELEEAVASLKVARTGMRELERIESTLVNRIKLTIGDHAGLDTELGRITWKPSKGRATVDYAAAAAALARSLHAEDELERLVAEHTKQAKPSRPFNVPRSWSKEA